ncbi:MAG: OprO/OprP family phosphate-selective porin [Verrucomicrobiales bacterium]|nr:OprO/OprP family phosphate-selective porin [Verrucomicrobiales bacterium]
MRYSLKWFLAAVAGISFPFSESGFSGESHVVIDDKCPVESCAGTPVWCSLFDHSTLYQNDSGIVKSVQIAGRYHGQYHNSSISHSKGNSVGAQYWEHRRFRLGTKIALENDITFFNNWNLGDSNRQGSRIAGDFWGEVYEMYIKWQPSGADNDFWVQIGKQEQKITREFATSSKKILTVERAFITNEVADTAAWGIESGFRSGGVNHAFGLWLGGFENDADGSGPKTPGFGNSRGGASYRGAVSLTEKTDLHFDYLFTNNSDGTRQPRGAGINAADEDALSNYNHVFAVGTESSFEYADCGRKIGLVTDIIWGVDREAQGGNSLGIAGGDNDSAAGEDTFGFLIMPSIDLTERLQFVAKYAYASNARMQRPQRQGYGRIGDARPNLDDVHTFYAGLNYRLCEDQLKLMMGYEYLTADLHENAGSTDLGSLTGSTWMVGVRTYW